MDAVPYQCRICKLRFARRRGAFRHLKRDHPDDAPHVKNLRQAFYGTLQDKAFHKMAKDVPSDNVQRGQVPTATATAADPARESRRASNQGQPWKPRLSTQRAKESRRASNQGQPWKPRLSTQRAKESRRASNQGQPWKPRLSIQRAKESRRASNQGQPWKPRLSIRGDKGSRRAGNQGKSWKPRLPNLGVWCRRSYLTRPFRRIALVTARKPSAYPEGHVKATKQRNSTTPVCDDLTSGPREDDELYQRIMEGAEHATSKAPAVPPTKLPDQSESSQGDGPAKEATNMEVGSLAKLVANVDIEEPQEACPPKTPPETKANQEPEASKESHLDNDITGEVRPGTCPPEAQTNQDQGAELQDDGEANSPEEVQSCMPEPDESADKESVSKESADPYPKPVEHTMPPKRKAPDTKDKQDDPLERVIPVLETLISKLDELNQTSQQMFQAQQQLRVEF